MQKAKQTFLALLNPYHSVITSYPNVIDKLNEKEDSHYLGVKNVSTIPPQFIFSLENLNIFQHTIDKASISGRAIDLFLTNPVSGKPMTGSSSGTAINVYLGINDIGLGTDGGGSVLAPALSLNLFSFIHPKLGAYYFATREEKQSTDGVSFSPSLGFITKKYSLLYNVVKTLFDLENDEKENIKLGIDQDYSNEIQKFVKEFSSIKKIDISDKYSKSRKELISQLDELLAIYDVIISKEGPVDLEGFGDTIFGHFDSTTQAIQENAKKGFVRVVTMAGASAFSIPSSEFAVGVVIISKSDNDSIKKMLTVANYIASSPDKISATYFDNLNAYFENGV